VSQIYFHFPSPFSFSSFLLTHHTPLSLPPQSFASAHHHHFRHRAPPSATSPTELHQRTATDNDHQELAGQTTPTAPDHCRHHQALMPTTIQCLHSPPTVPAPTIQSRLFLSHLLHLPSPPTTGT
jgi:hypothetical protein